MTPQCCDSSCEDFPLLKRLRIGGILLLSADPANVIRGHLGVMQCVFQRVAGSPKLDLLRVDLAVGGNGLTGVCGGTIQHKRDVERKMRFEKLIKEDKETFMFFKVTLDNLQKSVDLTPYDPASERVKQSESEESDEAQKWPNRMNPVKHEAIMIAKDLVISQK